MKRIIALCIGLLLSTIALAQLQVKEGSFKEIDGFINTHQSYQNDDNEKPYAVIIIRTENMSAKQRNELYFRGSEGAQTRIEHKVGEVWVYITHATKVITIAHEELSSTDFYFPYDLKPKKGYELTLTCKSSSGGFGSLEIKTNPEIRASIHLDERAISVTTPYVNEVMAVGHHKVELTKKGYKKVTTSVDIIDGMPSVLEITMDTAYGHINIKSSPSGARVYIDNKNYGFTPLSINEQVGEHTLRLTKDNCLTVQQTLEIVENENADLNVAMQTKKQVTIQTGRAGNQIYIDGKYAGLTPLTTQMTFEEHTIKAVDNEVEIVKNVRLDLDPEPQTIMMDFYNKIIIKSDCNGDQVYIDGKDVGTTPYIDRIKCGDHTVEVVGKFSRKKRQVSVETEGEFVYDFNLHTERIVNRKKRYKFYGNMLFSGWYIGPYVGFNNIIYTGDYIDKIKSGALSFETYPGTDPEFFGFKWDKWKIDYSTKKYEDFT